MVAKQVLAERMPNPTIGHKFLN